MKALIQEKKRRPEVQASIRRILDHSKGPPSFTRTGYDQENHTVSFFFC